MPANILFGSNWYMFIFRYALHTNSLILFHGAADGNRLSQHFSENIFLTISTLNEMLLIVVSILVQPILLPRSSPHIYFVSLRLSATTRSALEIYNWPCSFHLNSK